MKRLLTPFNFIIASVVIGLIVGARGCSRFGEGNAASVSRRLLSAIEDNDFNEATSFIAAGYGWRPIIDPDEHLKMGPRYFFPVHLAAGRGRVAILEELLCASVRRQLYGTGAVPGGVRGVDAIGSNLQELMRAGRLLRAGADIDARDEEGRTPVIWICDFHEPKNEPGQLACLRMLANAGADLEAKTAFYGKTALHRSAMYGDMVLVKELIALGANPNARDAAGNTPLHWACRASDKEGRLAVVRLLLEAGADPAAKNREGKTPRDFALEPCPTTHPDVVPLLENAVKESKARSQRAFKKHEHQTHSDKP